MEDKKEGKNKPNASDEGTTAEHRPRKGLEDWEMLQVKEDPPLKIPYWLPIIIVGLLVVSTLLTLPLMGVRSGFERPWLDWGLLVGVGYGVVSLVIIYFFMRNKKKHAAEKIESEAPDIKK